MVCTNSASSNHRSLVSAPAFPLKLCLLASPVFSVCNSWTLFISWAQGLLCWQLRSSGLCSAWHLVEFLCVFDEYSFKECMNVPQFLLSVVILCSGLVYVFMFSLGFVCLFLFYFLTLEFGTFSTCLFLVVFRIILTLKAIISWDLPCQCVTFLLVVELCYQKV